VKRLLLIAFVVFAPYAALAQGVQFPYEKVLIPIFNGNFVPGAYGSLWSTELIARNESDQFVEIGTIIGPCQIECPIGKPAHATFPAGEFTPEPNRGEFLYIGAPGAGKVTFSLRVQDVSRQLQTWGTAIPVVREKDVFSSALQLLDIPVDSRFRSALRIYDFDTPTENPRQVRLRIYDMCGIGPIDRNCTNTPLVDTTLMLTPTSLHVRDTQYPATAMVGNLLDTFPQLANVQPTVLPFGQFRPASVRVDIDPITPGLRFWAFVSGTNNETQHVTVIAPR